MKSIKPNKVKIPRPPSIGEELLAIHLKEAKIDFVRQFRFHTTRLWKADFSLRGINGDILIEIEGGVFMKKGGHTTGKSYSENCIKYNHAALMGFVVLRFTTGQVQSGEAINFIKQYLK